MKKPILVLLAISLCSGNLLSAPTQATINQPLLDGVDLEQGFEMVSVSDYPQISQTELDELIAIGKKPILAKIQESSLWKKFVRIKNDYGTKFAVAFVLALVAFVSVEQSPLAVTAVLTFAIHSIGHILYKHMSPIPVPVRGAILTGGFFAFNPLDRFISHATGGQFNPLISVWCLLALFLTMQNSTEREPVFQRPMDAVVTKCKSLLTRAGWKFEDRPDVNEFNQAHHIEVLIEKLAEQEDQLHKQQVSIASLYEAVGAMRERTALPAVAGMPGVLVESMAPAAAAEDDGSGVQAPAQPGLTPERQAQAAAARSADHDPSVRQAPSLDLE